VVLANDKTITAQRIFKIIRAFSWAAEDVQTGFHVISQVAVSQACVAIPMPLSIGMAA